MAGIEPKLFCEMEATNSKVGMNALESNVKVEVTNCQEFESIFLTTNCQTNMITSPVPKQTRTEHLVPNGCLKNKLGENGLIKHSSVLGEAIVCSNEYSEIKPGDNLDASSLGLSDDIEDQSLKPEDKEADNPVARLDCSLSRISLADWDFQNGIDYVVYESERQMPDIMRLITKDLSEPYSIYTYRYFIHNWPKLCFLAMSAGRCVGAIVCKLDVHKKMVRRGYIAMLAIDSEFRRKKIGSHLVLKAIKGMIADDCDEVVLETEITNKAALRLYENLGFVRDKRLFRYYLNGVDALRLKLWLR